MKLVLCCVIYSKSCEHQTISTHRDCLIHHCESVLPVPRCTVTLLSGLGWRKRNWEAKRTVMVGKKQYFLCVSSLWSESNVLVRNWRLPSAAQPLVLSIRGNAIYYCIYSRSCFALLSHLKILVQMVCGESMRALPGCSLKEESHGWDTGIPHGEHSVSCPFIFLCKGHLISG